MADKCDPIRSALRALEKELARTPPKITEPAEPGEPVNKPVPNPRVGELRREIEKSRAALLKCEGPKIPPPPPTPVPLTLTLTTFTCLDQSDSIVIPPFGNLEDDEPYALVFAIDLNKPINSKMTLVGPLGDVDEGDKLSAPANVIWGLSNAPDLVSSADNLIVLAAMMENDTGSGDQARSVLETSAQAALVKHLPAFQSQNIPRQELVRRMIAEMMGQMNLATVGVPDPDDNIGDIQELRYFQGDLDNIYKNFGPNEKSLTFEGDDAKYVPEFRMSR
jgi:hypothetical protein